MADRVYHAFLERQQAAGMALAEASDILTLVPMGPPPGSHYLAEFHCTGLVYTDGEIKTWDHFLVGLAFPEDYCRRPDSRALVTLLAPQDLWHPNVRFPVICPGMMPAGTGLVDLLFQTFEILTWETVGLTDPLNEEACRWARNNMDRFPLDRRPLKRRTKTASPHDSYPARSEPEQGEGKGSSTHETEDER
jgi:hypothetical protein